MVNERFREVVDVPDEALDLGRAALLIACDEYPRLDVDRYLARLDELADTVSARLRGDPSAQTILDTLNRYLFRELGFGGNRTDFYDPRNSFLNEVLDRKLGIPISLSVLYMELGRRLGVPLEGIPFPGHFLVKLELGGHAMVLDPFCDGAALSRSDLEARLKELMTLTASRPPDLGTALGTARKREILERMLRNLKAIYLRGADVVRALSVSNMLLVLRPENVSELRDRGLMLEYLDCGHAARADYRRYLDLRPDAEDAEDIGLRLERLRSYARTVH